MNLHYHPEESTTVALGVVVADVHHQNVATGRVARNSRRSEYVSFGGIVVASEDLDTAEKCRNSEEDEQ